MRIPWRDILTDAPATTPPSGAANANRANQANPPGSKEPEEERLARLAALALATGQGPPVERAADRAAEVAPADGAEGEAGSRVGAPLALSQASTTTSGIEAPGAAGAGKGAKPADPFPADDDPGVLVGDTGSPAGALRGIPEPSPQPAARRFLLALADRDITVTLDGEQIQLRPLAAVTPELLAEVRAQEPALVALLRCVGACSGPRVFTPRGPGLLCWHGRTGRLGVVLDSDPQAWSFFDPEDVSRA